MEIFPIVTERTTDYIPLLNIVKIMQRKTSIQNTVFKIAQ